jgi:hypothetical protein
MDIDLRLDSTGSRRVILVTGCPRSGTTAVGSVMAAGPHARYLYEPFNFHSGVRQVSRYFEVPGSEDFSMETFDGIIKGIRNINLNLRSGLFPEDRGLKRLFKKVVGGRSRVSYAMCRVDRSLNTVIWKDPIAVFASLAAAQRHQIPVLVTLRNPIAVAASFRRMRWAFDLENINRRLQKLGLDQSFLIDSFRDQLDKSIVNGAILWRLIYSTVLQWSKDCELIRVVDIADIIKHPDRMYKKIYENYSLPWSNKVERAINRKYAMKSGRWTRSSEDLPRRAHIAGRDLSELNSYGEKLLNSEEIGLIEEITGELWASYSESAVKLRS